MHAMEDSSEGSQKKILKMSRMDLVVLMRQTGSNNIEKQMSFLKQHLQNMCECSDSSKIELNHLISHITSQFKHKWIESNRTFDKFLRKNENWLQTVIQFPLYREVSDKKRGRQKVSFAEASDCSKRKKTQELRQNYSSDELSYAAQMSLGSDGRIEASKVLKDITNMSPGRAERYRKAFKETEEKKCSTITGEEALSMIIEAKLSRHQYEVIRCKDKNRFPSYKIVQNAKKLCYPEEESITISANCVQVELQALLNHTANRLVAVLKEVISTQISSGMYNVQLSYKWGFDGSSGLNPYKQKHNESNSSDCSIFLSSLVPLRMIKICQKDYKTVIWQNPRPSSTRYCRPIRMQFQKESTELSIAEKNHIENQINSLKPTVIEFENITVIVKHTLILAMIDGKICNALTDTKATQKCYLCGATSKQFNEIDKILKLNVHTPHLHFGLSILHGWIRCFECLLHISYKLSIKSWQARGEEAKKIVSENKTRIQKEFREKMGLLVDMPKPGFGNSNDGNTARRFFQNSELSASITGLDRDIINRFHMILISISSGCNIDSVKFRSYCRETARLYVQKYSWYCMPTTVHKLLIHGPDIIENSLLPIGQLSEEAQEARNKDMRKFREEFSRKCNRAKTNQDIFYRLLVSSDPIITNYRSLPKRKREKIPAEVLNMLLPELLPSPEENANSDDSELSSNSEDEGNWEI